MRVDHCGSSSLIGTDGIHACSYSLSLALLILLIASEIQAAFGAHSDSFSPLHSVDSGDPLTLLKPLEHIWTLYPVGRWALLKLFNLEDIDIIDINTSHYWKILKPQTTQVESLWNRWIFHTAEIGQIPRPSGAPSGKSFPRQAAQFPPRGTWCPSPHQVDPGRSQFVPQIISRQDIKYIQVPICKHSESKQTPGNTWKHLETPGNILQITTSQLWWVDSRLWSFDEFWT